MCCDPEYDEPEDYGDGKVGREAICGVVDRKLAWSSSVRVANEFWDILGEELRLMEKTLDATVAARGNATYNMSPLQVL